MAEHQVSGEKWEESMRILHKNNDNDVLDAMFQKHGLILN